MSNKFLQIQTKNIQKEKIQRKLSKFLSHDSRVHTPPVFFDVAIAKALDLGVTVFIKIYSPLTTKGSELTTISVLYVHKKLEKEFSFDEVFLVPFNYKKMSSIQKAEYIKTQIQKYGGLNNLLEKINTLQFE
jgi:hypothetical protein